MSKAELLDRVEKLSIRAEAHAREALEISDEVAAIVCQIENADDNEPTVLSAQA